MKVNATAVFIALILTVGGYQAWDRYQTSQETAQATKVLIVTIQSMKETVLKFDYSKKSSGPN